MRRVISRNVIVATAVLGLVSGLAPLAVGRLSATPERSSPTVDWQDCPAYSDEVLLARGITPERIPAAQALLDRIECGTVSVPLSYHASHSQHISVAITRLKAVDRKHRLGSLAVNPGGPGGSGYLMPFDLLMAGGANARLNDRYDLIGFDARGIGYSTKARCELAGGGPPAPGPLTEDAARAMYDAEVARNAACGQSDPDFLSELTTANVARDLDRVRAALGEPRISFLGVSWGTRLGAVYRSLFPQRVGRMFLDSVTNPDNGWEVVETGRAVATERGFARMAAWLAARDDQYGLGTTAAAVTATILELRRDYDANPRRYTDLPVAADGAMVARLAAQDSRQWVLTGNALRELRDATGTTAPPSVRQFFGGQTPPVPGAPEAFNPTMRQAIACNEESRRPDFTAAWTAYLQRAEQNPVTGRTAMFSANCAGWPLPATEVRFRHGGGSLVLSGHRHESATPYEWTALMRSAIGGRVFTVDDDVHGSAMRTPACAAEVVAYFDTGHIDTGCAGSPLPA
jgi:pimeloyl-ACP methyl ester carboxylesterase